MPLFPQSVYDSLPDGLEKLVSEHLEGSLRDISLLSILTISGSAMPLVKGVFRHREVYPGLYVSTVGESGSGKGSIAPPYQLVSLYHKKISGESRNASNIAFSIIKVCLKHSDFVATSLSKEKDKVHHTMPADMHSLFVKLSPKFTSAEAVKLGATRKISESRIEKMLVRALKCELIVRESYGCYVKTERGMHLFSEK